MMNGQTLTNPPPIQDVIARYLHAIDRGTKELVRSTYAITFMVRPAEIAERLAARRLGYLDRLRPVKGESRSAQRHALDWTFEAPPTFARSLAQTGDGTRRALPSRPRVA